MKKHVFNAGETEMCYRTLVILNSIAYFQYFDVESELTFNRDLGSKHWQEGV